jgi:hypothetical protein
VIAAMVLGIVLGVLLLFIPVGTLVSSLVSRQPLEAAQLLMYGVMVPTALGILLLAWRFSLNRPGWANIGVFVAIGTALVAAGSAAFVALAVAANASDSSHGGTVFVLGLGLLGVLMASASWLLWLTRRGLGTVIRG